MTNQILIKGDTYLLDRHLKAFIKKNVDAATRDFNFDRVSARQLSAQKITDLLKTAPMMAATRTVIVEDADFWKKEDWEEIVTYLANPNPDANFLAIAGKIDKRTSAYKAIAKAADVLEFKKPYDSEVPKFVEEEARHHGLTLQPGVSQVLAEVVGSDLMALVSELEKLKIYVHPETTVTKKHIEESVARGVLQNVFLISNLIGQKNLSEAVRVYQQLLEQGESLIGIVAILVGHFRKLLFASEAMAKRMNQAELPGLLGVSPYFLKDYLAQVRLFSVEQLRGIYQKLMDLSVGLRSSRLSQQALFEEFLQTVCLKRIS